jgi:aspartate beta-hydroxylase
MKVGEETKHCEDGVGMAADTSFIHSTYNDSEDRDRRVLSHTGSHTTALAW